MQSEQEPMPASPTRHWDSPAGAEGPESGQASQLEKPGETEGDLHAVLSTLAERSSQAGQALPISGERGLNRDPGDSQSLSTVSTK